MKTSEEIRTQAQKTFQAHLDYLSSGNIDGWMSLWNENGVLEFPFRPPVYPEKVAGKVAIREYVRHFPDALKIEFSKPLFHRTEDPSLVIAEFTGKGIFLPNGNPYNQTYISVLKTSDGKIDLYKDFWNPVVVMEAMGAGQNYQGALANL